MIEAPDRHRDSPDRHVDVVREIDALSTRLHNAEIDRQGFVDGCARLACRAVGCSRSGLWVFTSDSSERLLHCLGMYDAGADRMVQVSDRLQDDSAAYFEALRTVGNVVAIDAKNHPATSSFFDTGLRRHGIVSLMSAAFSLNGVLLGAFTCSQVGEPAQWTARHLATLTRIGARATLTLAAASPNQLSTFFGGL